jgi:hypothetical protein
LRPLPGRTHGRHRDDSHDTGDAPLQGRARHRRRDLELSASGRAGPSGGNLQPWRFLVVRDPEIKSQLGDVYRRAYDRYEPALLASMPEFPNEAAREAFERTRRASRHLAEHLGDAQALVLFLMPRIDLTLTDDEGPLDIGTLHASVYPAVQNFMVAARSLGIGTALTTVYRTRTTRAASATSRRASRSQRSSRWAGRAGASAWHRAVPPSA